MYVYNYQPNMSLFLIFFLEGAPISHHRYSTYVELHIVFLLHIFILSKLNIALSENFL